MVFKYSLVLNLGAKRLSRLIKKVYQGSGEIKNLFKRKGNP
ncbi:hypothetical protein IC006_0975 [Sulfuracidifex tepidarius]|uniref:Uncharacterized protein n=1 Tax=Sulfuracidifex tepidarius TaxID=1294262 RepID=A0A510DU49_9CREN|nr:hypothetical protein IC006_0975 [Sulfuracidifex tepidarius]BBG26439.1 hypothetical protein IC007_0947 [Sulfuracidifex tepidarius]